MKKIILKSLFKLKNLISKIENRLKEKKEASKIITIPIIQAKSITNDINKLTHIAAFTYGNAGDAILPTTVRDAIEMGSLEHFNWSGLHAHTKIDDFLINEINKTKGLVIGGGGLFLVDTNPNNLSGWQWSCSLDALKKINVPIAVFAVGYNRFRGQKEFSDLFTQHMNLLASKSIFFGLRNHGSIKNIKNYILEEHHNKIKFQPCPTTIISHLYPSLVNDNNFSEKPFIVLNCAFDRSRLRYGEDIGRKLTSIASVVKKLSVDFEIRYYVHVQNEDEHFLPFLDSLNVPYKKVVLNTHPLEIVKAYSKPALTIGMRGHSQMIPFGCKTPILSIISHEKMRYFIEDIQHPEWGVDINHPEFETNLLKSALNILSNREKISQELNSAQKILINITKSNVMNIRKDFDI